MVHLQRRTLGYGSNLRRFAWLTYVGQGLALNAHFKSNGDEIRVLAGAVNADGALVVKSDSPIKTAADFRGKKIAMPQLGNTQDISCRARLKSQEFKGPDCSHSQ